VNCIPPPPPPPRTPTRSSNPSGKNRELDIG
jgi:hypothetical protein